MPTVQREPATAERPNAPVAAPGTASPTPTATPHASPVPGGSAFGTTDLLLLFTVTVWGINYSAVKYGSQVMTPLAFTWLRVLITAITLLGIALFRSASWPRPRDLLGLLALGALGNGVYQLFFVFGVSQTRVADAALLGASSPIVVAIISQLRGTERARWRTLLGIVLSIAGVAVVVFGSTAGTHGQGSWLGIGLVLAAVICWSAFTVLLRPFTLRVDPLQLHALGMVGGMIPLAFVTPAVLPSVWRGFATPMWLVVAYSSWVSMGLVYLFWFRGVKVLGPTKTAIYSNLQPVVAILFAWAVLHEMPTAWQGLGAATIIAGIFLSRT